ncbi:hypothetical protein T484DRAFT_1832405 [Baffinella frigidus]|nr:hypothetical protein T484DRAFT_1832405 [Cryptophyta sp. CCMP2293]
MFPPQINIKNLVCAGDWVRMGDREHGAKGLCQERAYVSGLEAANALARSGLLGANRKEHVVVPVRADEQQVVLGRAANKGFMDLLDPFGLASPWAGSACRDARVSIDAAFGQGITVGKTKTVVLGVLTAGILIPLIKLALAA